MQPLAGYRVVDFGTALVGGLSPRLLGDLGAEVIKVESHVSLDGFRRGRPTIGDEAVRLDESLWPELQSIFHGTNRGKRSVTLNMNKPEGIQLIKRLIVASDVAMNNYSPGVLQRRGLDYESLTGIKPDIIVVSMPGMGEMGALRDYLSYAPTIGALSGMAGLMGYGPNQLIGALPLAWGDIVNALSGALATVAALFHRERTGEGQYIESSQLEASAALMGVPYLDYVMNGRLSEPRGNVHPLMTPHNTYPARDGRWIAIAVHTATEWASLCRVAGHGEWRDDPRFHDHDSRLANIDELDQLIADWTRDHECDELVTQLQTASVAATPLLGPRDRALDDYFADRQMLVEATHPLLGDLLLPGFLFRRWSEEPEAPVEAAPLLGEDNDYVLGELLGIPEAERARLVADEVVY